MNNTIKFIRSDEEIDLNTTEMSCIPSKEKYSEVDLCLNSGVPIQIGEILRKKLLSFEDRIKIGKEVEKRWNSYNQTNEKINSLVHLLIRVEETHPQNILAQSALHSEIKEAIKNIAVSK